MNYVVYAKGFVPQNVTGNLGVGAIYTINDLTMHLYLHDEHFVGLAGVVDDYIDLASLELENEQLEILVSRLSLAPPTGRQLLISTSQGRYIKDNMITSEEDGY